MKTPGHEFKVEPKTLRFKYSDVPAADWQTIYRWVLKDEERLNMFEKRISKKFVVDFMKEHGSISEETGETTLGDPPPGVNIHREFVARVRK